jgi:hypothetical protein
MELAALLVLAALAAAAILFVVFPLVRPLSARDLEPELSPQERERRILVDRRDELYAALRELELEHRTGKLNDADLAGTRAALRAEAVDVLRRLEELDRAPAGNEALPAPPRAAR